MSLILLSTQNLLVRNNRFKLEDFPFDKQLLSLRFYVNDIYVYYCTSEN